MLQPKLPNLTLSTFLCCYSLKYLYYLLTILLFVFPLSLLEYKIHENEQPVEGATSDSRDQDCQSNIPVTWSVVLTTVSQTTLTPVTSPRAHSLPNTTTYLYCASLVIAGIQLLIYVLLFTIPWLQHPRLLGPPHHDMGNHHWFLSLPLLKGKFWVHPIS